MNQPKSMRNGLKWYKTVHKGLKWLKRSEMIQYSSNLFKAVQNGLKETVMVYSGLKLPEMVQNISIWSELA
jgi:hypothetical protein